MYICCWLIKKYDQNDWAVDPDSWAITIVHAIISSTFVLYVIALDIAALIFRDHTPKYYNESYNAPLYRYPGTVLFWDILAVIIIIAVLIFIALAAKDHNNAAMNIFHCGCIKQVRAKNSHFSAPETCWSRSPSFCCCTRPLHNYRLDNRHFLCYWHWN